MNLDQIAKIIGIVKNLFVILLITIVLGCAVMIRHRIDKAFESTEQTITQNMPG